MDMSTASKLAYRWQGPYRVRRAISEKGTYELEEFDGTPIPGTCPGNRLKKFVKRKGIYEPISEEKEEEEEYSASAEQPQTGPDSEKYETVLPQTTLERQRVRQPELEEEETKERNKEGDDEIEEEDEEGSSGEEDAEVLDSNPSEEEPLRRSTRRRRMPVRYREEEEE